MDNRHKHIQRLIDNLVVPKANKILMDAGDPTITNVDVDTIDKPSGILMKAEHISIMIFHKNQEGGKYVSVSRFAYPISGMIMTLIPYVITGNYRVTLTHILMDNMDSSIFRFNSNDNIESFTYYLELLDARS
jgi:hypothetical protein